MAVFVFTIPESPSWLVHKKYYSRADDALNWLGRDQEEFASEVEQDIQNRMSELVSSQTGRRNSKPGLLRRCSDKLRCLISRASLIPLLIIILLFFVQNCSGFIVVIMNVRMRIGNITLFCFGLQTVLIFKEAKISLDEFQATILVGLVQVLGMEIIQMY